MYTIDCLKHFSNATVKSWIHKHMMDADGNLRGYASHHELVNGQMICRMITYDEFFQYVETDLNSNEITIDFTGCGIKGPFNLYLLIKNDLDEEYLNHFPNELKEKIVKHVAHHEYLKKICDLCQHGLPDTKSLLGMFYLSYILDYKNEIYDILLDYKMRVVQYNLEI